MVVENEQPKMRQYIVVRSNLSRGQQLAQSAHAGIELVNQINNLNDRFKLRIEIPETVVVLRIRGMWPLFHLYDSLPDWRVKKLFFEPAYSQFTALSYIGTGEHTAHLKLAGKRTYYGNGKL